uniref:Cytochrome P450 n=1 Tax=Oryza brachyantha TaxID=4533 RepID=J3LVF7_ORYBR
MGGMVDTAAFYTLLCGALLFVTLVVKLKKATNPRQNGGVNLPPGPWGLPVIGSIHCLLGSLPHHVTMRNLALRYGPVMLLRLGHVQTLVLSSPEAAREAMKTHDVAFATRAVTPTASILTYGARDIVFAPFGKHLRELRKLCTLELLSPKRRDGGLGITLTKEIVSAVLFDLFAAGSETTPTTIIWAMSELMRNPHVMERAQSEIRQVLHGKSKVSEADIEDQLHYLHLVIRETLRLHPPVPFVIPRLCSEPNSKIMGYDIPLGTTVLVNVSAIGRDKKIWKDADEFRPERFKDDIVDFSGTDFRFIPGGAGRRMCPGLTFGVSNIEIVLASLLYHFDWKLPSETGECELDMSEIQGVTARRRTDLLLKATHVYA